MTYSCWTDDPNDPRGRPTEIWVQDGWRYVTKEDGMTREPVMVRVVTAWRAVTCGHSERILDDGCEGCANRSDD